MWKQWTLYLCASKSLSGSFSGAARHRAPLEASVCLQQEFPLALRPELCYKSHNCCTSCPTRERRRCCEPDSHCIWSWLYCPGTQWALESGRFPHPSASSTPSCWRPSAYREDSDTHQFSTCHQSMFRAADDRMAERELQLWTCGCPPCKRDSSAWRRSQHTCACLLAQYLNINYTSYNGSISLLDQSCISHRAGSGTASCLCQIDGKCHSNILRTLLHTLYISVEPLE